MSKPDSRKKRIAALQRRVDYLQQLADDGQASSFHHQERLATIWAIETLWPLVRSEQSLCNRCREILQPYPLAHMPEAVACLNSKCESGPATTQHDTHPYDCSEHSNICKRCGGGPAAHTQQDFRGKDG